MKPGQTMGPAPVEKPVTSYARPLPQADPDSRPYWEWARKHELRILRCGDCGTFVHFPRPLCWNCQSFNLSWERVSGRGRVYSYVIVHHPAIPSFADQIPYAIVVVELEEQKGLRVPSNLVDCPLDRIRIDLPVEVVFEDVTEEITLPKFRPAAKPT